MKALKKALIALLGAVLGCWFFVGCLSTKLSVTYMVDGVTYQVQSYEMDTQIGLPAPPTKDGYTFIGWYTDEALTTPYTAGKVTAGFTLYAKFSQDYLYISVNTAGGAPIAPIEVIPGADYTVPAAEKEGYTFIGYTYFDVATNSELDFPMSGKYPSTDSIQITAKYEINKYTVTLENSDLDAQEVEHGGKLSALLNTEKAGWEFKGWYTTSNFAEGSEFDATATTITGDLTLYAKYEAKTFNITVNGAQAGYAGASAVYGQAYTLPIPDLGDGYEFDGFKDPSGNKLAGYVDTAANVFVVENVYSWTTDVAFTAAWKTVYSLIYFNDGDTTVFSYMDKMPGTAWSSIQIPSVPAKDGYDTDAIWYTDKACTIPFVQEGVLPEGNVTLYAKYTAKTYVVTFKVWRKGTFIEETVNVKYGEKLTAPAVENREGFDFVGYTYDDDTFDINAPYSYAKNITVEEKWTSKEGASLFEYVESGNYFRERENAEANWTYVYLIGETYTYADTISFSYANANDAAYVTVNGNVLTIKAAGTFTLNVNNNGVTYTRTIKTVEYIKSMALLGTGYDTAWGLNEAGTDYKRSSTGVWDATFTVGAEVMKVGKTNFIPEVSINGKVSSFNANFTATVVLADGTATTDYTIANGAINFGNTLVGKRVVVTVKPIYAVNEKHQATYTVDVNEAVNVYTHEDLKAAFANTSVTQVNILRNIVPTLTDSEVYTYTDEWGKTQKSPIDFEYRADDGVKDARGVYVRRSGDLKINGNYFTVDGSKLPLVDARAPEVKYHTPTTYGILDNHFSIFLFGKRHSGGMSNYQIDNLNIQGNGDMDARASYKVNNYDVLKYSGATINVNVGGGRLDMTNVTSRFGSFALYGYSHANFADSCSVIIKAKDCILDKSWANNLYAQGFIDTTLDSCFVGQANGVSIHYDVRGNENASDAALYLLNGTKVENWVTGQEAWFTAQGASAVADAIKGDADPGLKGATQNAKTLLKYIDGKEYFNAAIVMRQTGDNGLWATDGKDAETHLKGLDTTFIEGYLKPTYGTAFDVVDALGVNFTSFDLEYAGFIAATQGNSAAGAYAMAHINEQFVKVRKTMPGMGYLEFYLTMA